MVLLDDMATGTTGTSHALVNGSRKPCRRLLEARRVFRIRQRLRRGLQAQMRQLNRSWRFPRDCRPFWSFCC